MELQATQAFDGRLFQERVTFLTLVVQNRGAETLRGTVRLDVGWDDSSRSRRLPLEAPGGTTTVVRWTEPYDRAFVATLERTAIDLKSPVKRAVYVAVAGPNLETAAEYRFLRTIGADTVGMSSVPECLVAVHGGMRVIGLSVVTDACFPDALKPADVAEIIRVANATQPRLEALVTGFLENVEL